MKIKFKFIIRKNILVQIICVLIITLISCDNEIINHKTSSTTSNTTTTVKHKTTTTTVKTPNDWAMLDIVDRYNVPDATFANWQDGHIYMICIDSIKIIDMSDDTSGDRITIVDEIPFSLNELSGDWAELKGFGIADIGTKILMLANLKNEDKSVKTLLSIRHDGSEFMLSEHRGQGIAVKAIGEAGEILFRIVAAGGGV